MLQFFNFGLSRKTTNIYNNKARKHGKLTVKDFRKYDKLKYNQNKLKLGINFLSHCKQLGLYPKLRICKLRSVSNKNASSILKTLLPSAINKCNNKFQHFLRELSQTETFLSKRLSAIDFYILNRYKTSRNKKSLQKLLNTEQKKLPLLTRNCSLPTFTATNYIY